MKYVKLNRLLEWVYEITRPVGKEGDVEFVFHLEKIDVTVGVGSYGRIHVYSLQPRGKIVIGNYTSISEITVLIGGDHHFGITTYPFKAKYFKREVEEDNQPVKGIKIGNDCWIGQDTTLLDGVTIGDGSVIGARSVVARDIPPYSIAVGNPAIVIRQRFSNEEIRLLLQCQWWNIPKQQLLKQIDKLYSSNVQEFVTSLKNKH